MFCKLLISWKFEGRYFSKYPSFVFWVKKKKLQFLFLYKNRHPSTFYKTFWTKQCSCWLLVLFIIIIPQRIFQLAKNSKVQVMLRLLSKCWHKIEWLDVDLFRGMRIFLEALHSPRTRKQTFHDFFFWFEWSSYSWK